ncbi:GspH/FimT family pseudopilin [Pseudorhodoferax sp.]|uniref:GspH/FimT family pseudopilin n=1 Tax=Pseudorhodoferax sp. TaxID=1993553 RepID=UPI0039E5050A
MLCPSCGFPSSSRGFTAIELMVVVAVLAVLAALAGPSLVPVIERWRVRQATEEMAATFAYARSEAIKRGGGVAVVRNAPAGGECASPADDAADWSCGWTVFDDANGDGVLGEGEATLRVSPPTRGLRFTNLNGDGAYRLSRWGELQGGALGFAVAPARSGSPVVGALCIGAGGRVRARPGVATCA